MSQVTRYGCGRKCTIPKELSTAAQPAAPINPDLIARFSSEERQRIVEDFAKHDVRMAHHEAGHVVAAALYGRTTEYVITGTTPHACFASGGEKSEQALVAATIAARVAEGYAEHRVIPPADDEMAFYLAKTRQNTTGSCDECYIATLLRALYPDENDKDLSARWRNHFHRTADLFDRVEVRCAVRRLARELEAKVRVERDEIERLIGHLAPSEHVQTRVSGPPEGGDARRGEFGPRPIVSLKPPIGGTGPHGISI